jgi:hypothetical protein
MKLDVLSQDMKELVEEGPPSDPESMEELLRIRNQVDACLAVATREFDQWGEYAADGAQTAAAWLATKGHLPKGEARRIVKRARALHHFPTCTEAWKDGELSGAYLDSLIRARNPRTEDAMDRDEEKLTREGCQPGRHEEFVRRVDYWEQENDPDGTEEAAERQRAKRDVYLVPSLDGLYFGQMTLDPISGAIVANELKRLTDQLFEAEWNEAKDRLGFEPTIDDLKRTPSHRRADALREMATRSGTAPADGKSPQPLFSVLVNLPTLSGRVCELAQGIVVTPGSLVPWLDRALIERAVFEPPDRVQVSAKARLFTGATRRGIELRDRECTHPYCDRPAADCQADHIQPYAQGGPTTQENGRLLCGFHNRLRNERPPPPRE